MHRPLAKSEDLVVEIIGSAEELRTIADDWDDLWRRSETTMPTVCAEPAAIWIETFAPRRRVHILTVRSAGRLVGALPLVERKLGRLVSAGDLSLNHWSPNGELLLDKQADVAAVTARLAEAVCDVPWPLLWFGMVPYRSHRWTLLTWELQRCGATVDVRPGFEIGKVSLQEPLDTYLAARSKNLRRSTRKDLKRLERKAPVELRLLDRIRPEQVENALRDVFQLEHSGWKGKAGTSVLTNEGIFDFYRRQAECFAQRDALRVAFLECGGRPIACELGWFGKAVYHSLKVGYDERFRKYAPGQLLRWKLIEAGCADPNLDFIDFQGPMNDALRAWTTEIYSIGRIAVCPPRAVSKALWIGLRAARSGAQRLRRAAVSFSVGRRVASSPTRQRHGGA